MTVILFICHLFFNFKTRFVQKHTLKGIKHTFSRKNGGAYAAFASALGTTIGPGNITGVAVAIATGGAGAVFWIWLSGLLAMPTKYAESYLCLKYKQNGVGGPMVLLKRFGYRRLSVLWCCLCVMAGLFMGAAVPSRALCDSLSVPTAITSAALAFLVVITVSFGARGISTVCSYLVPVMSAAFIVACVVIIIKNPTGFVSAVAKIVRDAFDARAVFGGGMGVAIKSGITRGLYSNESGLGSGGVLAAESCDDNIALGALGAMTTVLWDTVVMCALTGVVFVMGGGDVNSAFCQLPFYRQFLGLSMAMFSFATIIGWYYIYLRVCAFLGLWQPLFDAAYIVFVFLGGVLPPSFLWQSADSINLCMLIPSLFIFMRLNNKISLYISNN